MTRPRWLFDNSAIPDPMGHGERAVEFLRRLRHPKSTAPGRAFQLDRWQERLVRRIYGPRHADGRRVVSTVFLLLPRGNRKTTLAAALAALHCFGPERLPGGEVVSAAADRKQARLAFAEAEGLVRADARIERAMRVVDSRNRMTLRDGGSFYEAISADAGTQHGRTPAFVLADELHAWPKRDLWDVLRSGTVKTRGSLVVIATTAGKGEQGVAWELYTYAKRVASGEIDDPAFLPVLLEADPSDDWRDERVWKRVNPGLSCDPPYPDMDGLRQLAREAENRPGDRDAFRQLNLNVWAENSTSPFVDMPVWDRGNRPVDLDALGDRPCWLGVDLSKSHDLTAIVAAWRDDAEDGTEGYIVHPWAFCPAENIALRSRRDHAPYARWAAEGLLEATPGEVIDLSRVEAVVRELCDRFNVQEIAFDPYGAEKMMTALHGDGLPAVAMRQGWVTMAPAIAEFGRAVIAGRLAHGDHPVLRWAVGNVATETDKAGNVSFHKGKSRDRIDPAVACAMAVGRAFHGHSSASIYNIHDRPGGIEVWS